MTARTSRPESAGRSSPTALGSRSLAAAARVCRSRPSSPARLTSRALTTARAGVCVRARPARPSAQGVADAGVDGPEDPSDGAEEVVFVVVITVDVGDLDRRDLGLREHLELQPHVAQAHLAGSDLVRRRLDVEPKLVEAVFL